MILKNKLGGEYLSIWWFFVLIVIATGLAVAIMSNVFAESNIKKVEADILNTKIINCLINQETLPDYLLGRINLNSQCNISSDLQSRFIEIAIFPLESCSGNYNSCSNFVKQEIKGDLSLKASCFNEIKGNIPSCTTNYILYPIENKNYIIKIETGSNIAGKRT